MKLVKVSGDPFADNLKKVDFDPFNRAEIQSQPAHNVNQPDMQLGHEPGSSSLLSATESPIGLLNARKIGRNLPGNAMDFAEGMWEVAKHPVDTAKGIGRIATGFYDEMTTGKDDPVASEVRKMIGDKYGSVDNFMNSIEERPFDAAIDIAGGSGIAAKVLGKAGEITGVEKLADMGRKANVVAGAVDTVATPPKWMSGLPDSVPRKLMESTAKASTVTDRVARNKFMDSLIKHGIVPNDAGLSKVWDGVEMFGSRVDDLVKGANGKQISKQDLFKNINNLLEDAKFSDEPINAQRQVQRVVDAFDEAHGDMLSPADVQRLKQGIYKGVNYDRKARVPKPQYTVLAKKDIARAAKEELEFIYPELKYLNAEEGEFLSMIEPLTKAVNRISNRDMFGMGSAIKGGAGSFLGKFVGGEAGQMAGFLAGVISSSPKLQARFAITLDRAKKLAMKNTGGVASNVQLQSQRSQQFGGEQYAPANK